ncbi:tRNA (adenosine(37)-N6)-threonylcarbamoyltransferase complex dimerization subunit type 1 TsaB [Patescibacteria group bacterium]|nr:tRNA (adenosine(37)-N6)-threonylcarbamoyltransferase complex dimerization subunit type 1 TsaB [Patescibacteria group bacterium]
MNKQAAVLHIDTSKTREVRVSLDYGGAVAEREATHENTKAQEVLALIEDLCREQHIRVSDITEITVAVGPGSFTGLRVGAAVANTLGTLLDVPINGKKTLATPVYS